MLVGYILLTLALHIFGPWDFREEKLDRVIIFIAFVLVAFILGFRSSIKTKFLPQAPDVEREARNFSHFRAAAKIILILQLFLLLAAIFSDYSAGRLNLDLVANPGQIYINALEAAKDEAEVSFFGKLKTLAAPFFYFATVFFVLNFSKFTKSWRLYFSTLLVGGILQALLARGAQKVFFDLLILLVSIGFVSAFWDARKFKKLVAYGCLLFISALILFAIFQLSRLEAYDALDYSGEYRMSLDRYGLFFSIFGERIGLGLALFISYVSQGYYGLSLCLQLPFEWTYGVGNSFALTSYAEQYFGIVGVYEMSYPARMEAVFGWPAKMYWHTFFPWAASDISFPGVVVLMFFIGRIYGKSFLEAVVYKSPLAATVFYFLTTLLLYLPANNQLMQSREMTIGFLVVLVYWLFMGKKFGKLSRRRVSGDRLGAAA